MTTDYFLSDPPIHNRPRNLVTKNQGQLVYLRQFMNY